MLIYSLITYRSTGENKVAALAQYRKTVYKFGYFFSVSGFRISYAKVADCVCSYPLICASVENFFV